MAKKHFNSEIFPLDYLWLLSGLTGPIAAIFHQYFRFDLASNEEEEEEKKREEYPGQTSFRFVSSRCHDLKE